MLQPCHIDHFDTRQLHALKTLSQRNEPILAGLRIVVGFHGWSGGAQHGFGTGHVCQDDGCRSRMVSGSRVLLLVRVFMFLIDNDQTQFLKR